MFNVVERKFLYGAKFKAASVSIDLRHAFTFIYLTIIVKLYVLNDPHRRKTSHKPALAAPD